MLVRAFRVTDRLGNALLRVAAWAALAAVEQTAHLKNGLIALIVGVFSVIAGAVGLVVGTVRRTRRTAEQAVQITQAGRRDRMAQRAAAAEPAPPSSKTCPRPELRAKRVRRPVAGRADSGRDLADKRRRRARRPVGTAAGSWSSLVAPPCRSRSSHAHPDRHPRAGPVARRRESGLHAAHRRSDRPVGARCRRDGAAPPDESPGRRPRSSLEPGRDARRVHQPPRWQLGTVRA